jgi:hypothetical protein
MEVDSSTKFDEIEPQITLHRFIAIIKTDEQFTQLKHALISGKIDINEVDEKGFSALHWAVLFENDQVVELLVQLNVNQLFRDLHYDSTALDYAVGRYANPIIARSLLQSSDQQTIQDLLGSKNSDGDTALHVAVRYGNYSCITVLLQHGSSPSENNHKDQKPIDIAKSMENQNEEMVDIIEMLEGALTKESHSKCWQCGKMWYNGTKRCSRCHYARYCNRECQVAHWKCHKVECEPVVLGRSDGRFLDEFMKREKASNTIEIDPDFNDYICVQIHRTGYAFYIK